MIIGICDDIEVAAQALGKMVGEILQQKGEEHEVRVYTNGFDLLEDAEDLELIFLDMVMPTLDGLETGRKLREINDECKLIYATAYEISYKETVKLRVLRYITKPYRNKEIEEALNAYLGTRLGNETIEVFLNRIPYQLPQKDIEYIVGNQGGYVEIKVGKNWYRKAASLKMVEQELNSTLFCKIHRKYVVNLAKVREYRKGIIYIKETELQPAFRCRKYFEEQYHMFVRKYLYHV